MDGFEGAARQAVRVLTREQVEQLARWVEGDPEGSSVLDDVTVPALREAASNVLAALNLSTGQIRPLASAYLRALSDGYRMGLAERPAVAEEPGQDPALKITDEQDSP